MSTLIAVYGAHGECMGRCDAKCYDAKHEHCDCICGGRNHGTGRNKAIENTRDLADQWLEECKSRYDYKDAEVFSEQQLALF